MTNRQIWMALAKRVGWAHDILDAALADTFRFLIGAVMFVAPYYFWPTGFSEKPLITLTVGDLLLSGVFILAVISGFKEMRAALEDIGKDIERFFGIP